MQAQPSSHNVAGVGPMAKWLSIVNMLAAAATSWNSASACCSHVLSFNNVLSFNDFLLVCAWQLSLSGLAWKKSSAADFTTIKWEETSGTKSGHCILNSS